MLNVCIRDTYVLIGVGNTVAPILKNHDIGHKNMFSSRQVVFGDTERISYMYNEM